MGKDKKDESEVSVEVVEKTVEAPRRRTSSGGIMVKNKTIMKRVLYFPLGRVVKFAPLGTEKLEQAEIDSEYFQNRKDYFSIIGG